jgi:hypothetical protein
VQTIAEQLQLGHPGLWCAARDAHLHTRAHMEADSTVWMCTQTWDDQSRATAGIWVPH